MKRKTILAKFLYVLAPIYLLLVIIGSLIAAQILIRDTTDEVTARVGGLAARVSIALDIHEAYTYSTLASDLIAPLGVDPAVVCVEFRTADASRQIATHPPRIGCTGQQDAPFESSIPVDDFGDYELYLKFSDGAVRAAVNKQILTTAGILTFAFLITIISAAIGFRMIVSSRLLALHGAIKMAAENINRQRVQSSGQDELTEIINAYNSLMDQDAVRERQLTAANEILSLQSKQDPLTGLFNRRFFNSLVDKELSKGNHVTDRAAMLLLDIDHFKQINDNFGHTAGDEVLVDLANRLKNCLPDGTPIVRWGGEEILIYLKELDYNEVNSFASLLLNSVGATPINTSAGGIKVTTSIGIVRLPFSCGKNALTPDDAIKLADLALYKAKELSRNCAVAIAEQSLPDAKTKLAIENNFEQALTAGLIHVEIINGPSVATPHDRQKAA